jgi:hypothetical protein
MDVSLALNKEESETYLVKPAVAAALAGEPILHRCTVFTAITRQKNPFLFPVRLQDSDGRWNSWHRSAYEAAERAMTDWVRITSNKEMGGYDLHTPIANLSPPDWSELPTFAQVLKLGFQDYLIEDRDHPFLKRLRGEI